MSPSHVLPCNVTLTALSQRVGHMCPSHAPKLGYVPCLTGKLDGTNAMDFCLLLGTLYLHS